MQGKQIIKELQGHIRDLETRVLQESRILFVAYENVIIENFIGLLKVHGYNADYAQSGELALTKLKDADYHLLISEKDLAGINGLELTLLAKELQPNLEFIFITGYGALQSAMEAIRLGASDYLLKPVPNPNIFLRKVETALKLRHHRHLSDLVLEAVEESRNKLSADPAYDDSQLDTQLDELLRKFKSKEQHKRVMLLEPSLDAFLERAGYDVVRVETAESMYEQIATRSFNLAIASHGFPGLSVPGLAVQFKDRAPEIEILLISDRNTLNDTIGAFDFGAYDFVVKPLEGLENLSAKLERALKIQNQSLLYHNLIEGLGKLELPA